MEEAAVEASSVAVPIQRVFEVGSLLVFREADGPAILRNEFRGRVLPWEGPVFRTMQLLAMHRHRECCSFGPIVRGRLEVSEDRGRVVGVAEVKVSENRERADTIHGASMFVVKSA